MKISIITTAYNASQYIQETIESVLSQDFPDFEYIVIDDCSTDNTISIAKTYNDTRIKLYINERNLGIVGSRNKGLSLAQGEYICFLDHDDIWHSQQKLLKQVDYMDKHKDVGIVGSYCICFEGDKDIEWLKFGVTDNDIRSKILITNQFTTCSVMVRKSILDQVGLFDPIYEKVDDYDLRLRIGQISKYANIPEFLVKYRYHTNNTTRQSDNLRKMRIMTIDLIEKYKKSYPNARIGIFIQYFLMYFPIHWFSKMRKVMFSK